MVHVVFISMLIQFLFSGCMERIWSNARYPTAQHLKNILKRFWWPNLQPGTSPGSENQAHFEGENWSLFPGFPLWLPLSDLWFVASFWSLVLMGPLSGQEDWQVHSSHCVLSFAKKKELGLRLISRLDWWGASLRKLGNSAHCLSSNWFPLNQIGSIIKDLGHSTERVLYSNKDKKEKYFRRW